MVCIKLTREEVPSNVDKSPLLLTHDESQLEENERSTMRRLSALGLRVEVMSMSLKVSQSVERITDQSVPWDGSSLL